MQTLVVRLSGQWMLRHVSSRSTNKHAHVGRPHHFNAPGVCDAGVRRGRVLLNLVAGAQRARCARRGGRQRVDQLGHLRGRTWAARVLVRGRARVLESGRARVLLRGRLPPGSLRTRALSSAHATTAAQQARRAQWAAHHDQVAAQHQDGARIVSGATVVGGAAGVGG